MQVEIEIEREKKFKEVVNGLGMDSKELVNRALLLYIDNISRYADLNKEMKAWDFLSDEALKNFEKTL